MRKKASSHNRYAIYLRCSTDDQTQGDFTTIDTQRKINSRYINEHGGILAGEYVDEGRTGTNLNRPGWKELLKDAKAGLFDYVCCTYMSRMARGNQYYVAEYLLNEVNVSIVLVQEHFTLDLAGHVNREMTILMDGIYPKMVSQWTSTKMSEMVAQGYFCGGTIPFGYLAVPVETAALSANGKTPPKKLVVNPDEAKIVEHAFNRYLEKDTIASVRDYLNSVTARKWTMYTTKYLLTNCTYTGIQQFGKWHNDNAHPALIDRETWQLVQDRLRTASQKNTRGPRSDEYTYYLRGLITCPHCGCKYTNSCAKNGAVRYYECHHGKKKLTNCPVCRVNADALHEAVLKEIKHAVEHRTVMHRLIRDSEGWSKADGSLKAQRGQLGKLLQFTNVQINNLTTLLAAGRAQQSLLSKLDTLEYKKNTTAAEIERLDNLIAKSTLIRPTAEMVQSAWARLTEAWDYISEEERIALMGTFVKEVVVNEKNSVTLHMTINARNPEFRIRNNLKNGSGDWI
ncbi:MAG TPA: hypothetical protein DCL60_03765 [Armatimonadetes bacterium]|nr:hypothetical protein [Armatimonadota bacterium]